MGSVVCTHSVEPEQLLERYVTRTSQGLPTLQLVCGPGPGPGVGRWRADSPALSLSILLECLGLQSQGPAL